jgi:O-antigen/teichoic acid export membrane protein
MFANAGIYGTANAVNAAVPYLLLPVVIRYLNPAEYGYYSIFLVLFQLMTAVIGFTTQASIARVYFDPESHDLPVYVFNCMLVMAASVVILLLLVIGVPKACAPEVLPLDLRWVLAALLSGIGQYVILVQLALWQMQSQPLRYAVFQFFSMLALMGLTILNVVVFRMGWAGCVRAHITTYLSFGGVALFTLTRGGLLRPKLDLGCVRHALGYGAPLIPHNLGSWVINMMDRIIILRLMGPAETGIYSFGYQFGMALALIQNSFNQAYVPWLFKKLKESAPGVRWELVRLAYGYSLGILAIALMMGLLGPWLVRLMGTPAYASAQGIVIWVALAYAMNGMYKMVSNYIFYVQKTYLLAIATFSAAIINLFFTLRWVKSFGAIGAAYATTLAFGISFLIVWVMSNRVFPMPWFPWSRAGKDHVA